MELPPRARRILLMAMLPPTALGTTSACAENTQTGATHPGRAWNYLRVRGEYACACSVFCIAWELPPRARRIPPFKPGSRIDFRTTSACAENTSQTPLCPPPIWNYLRVRGEYISIARFKSISWELPPRARRIQMAAPTAATLGGTTSACAENTGFGFGFFRLGGNYLRVRGEYTWG